jgi:hypothetical protein
MPMLERAAPLAGPDTTTAAIAEIRAVLSAQVHADADAEHYADDDADQSSTEFELADDEAGQSASRPTFGHGPIRLHTR